MDLLTPAGNGLGLIPDTPDIRDLRAAEPPLVPYEFVDLEPSPFTPPVWDQGQIGSCTAHGTLAAYLYAAAFHGLTIPMLSRLMLYWRARSLEGTIADDAGAQVRDAVKATALGLAPESEWPYDTARFADTPPLTDATHMGLRYWRIRNRTRAIQHQLSAGHPVIVGMLLYESFEYTEAIHTGLAPTPDTTRERELGGHCMAAWGIGTGDDWHSAGQFLSAALEPDALYVKMRNSWGLGVYQRGYLLVPAEYLTDHQLGWDFWTIRRVS